MIGAFKKDTLWWFIGMEKIWRPGRSTLECLSRVIL